MRKMNQAWMHSEGHFSGIQNEINLLDYLNDSAFDRGLRIVCNPSRLLRYMEKYVEKISIFMLNEVEGFQMTGEREPEKILDVMAERFPQAEAVLTLGEKGAGYRKGTVKVRQDCIPADAENHPQEKFDRLFTDRRDESCGQLETVDSSIRQKGELRLRIG